MGVYQHGKQAAGSTSRGNGHGKVVPLSDRRPFREGETHQDEAWVQFCENCRP
jgi:hypothetical protein